jgi:AraC family transcriptional activator of tynA and feaB
MQSWSTTSVRPRERFSYWREVVCKTVLNVSTECPVEGFSASIKGRNYGSLRFAAFMSSPHEIVRSESDVAAASEANYLVSLQTRGVSHISQGDERICLKAGEIAVVDGQRPFRVQFPESVSRILAVIPRDMIVRRAPWMSDLAPCRKISLSSPYGDLARRHLLHLSTKDAGNLSPSEAILIADNLCNLLALASAREVKPAKLGPELLVPAALAFCLQHLHDPELSPSVVAAHLGISVRTLHLHFQKSGKSFSRWLLDSRLEACSKTLRDPLQSSASILEIAYLWGFNDLSHFNKAFRARYGMPPGQWRSGGMHLDS